MRACDSTVVLIPRPSGDLSIHDAKTGRLLGELPACVVRGEAPSLDEQMQATTVRLRSEKRERREEVTAGLFLGTAFVCGVAIGVLLTWI